MAASITRRRRIPCLSQQGSVKLVSPTHTYLTEPEIDLPNQTHLYSARRSQRANFSYNPPTVDDWDEPGVFAVWLGALDSMQNRAESFVFVTLDGDEAERDERPSLWLGSEPICGWS